MAIRRWRFESALHTLLIITGVFIAPLLTLAQTYSVATVDAGVLPSPLQVGNIGTEIVSINNMGETLVTFSSFDPTTGGSFQVFLRDTDVAGTTSLVPSTTLEALTSKLSFSKSLIVGTNQSGGIVIEIDRSSGHPVAGNASTFVFSQNAVSPLVIGTGAVTSLVGVNDLGQIIGTFQQSGPTTHVFILDKDRTTILEQFDLTDPPNAMNNFLDIIGNTSNGSGFLLDRQRTGPIPISCPGAISTGVSGINDEGDISGGFIDSAFEFHAFVWTDHDRRNNIGCTAIDGDVAGAFNAASINNAGQVAGTFNTIVPANVFGGFLNVFHGYVATPLQLKVARLSQGDSRWGGLPYAHHPASDTKGTIGRLGCALTALTMTANSDLFSTIDAPVGASCVQDSPDLNGFVSVTPKNMNCLFLKSNGYNDDSDVSWDDIGKVIRDAAKRANPLAATAKYEFMDLSSVACNSMGCQSTPAAQERLVQLLSNRATPVIVGVRVERRIKGNGSFETGPTHFVVVGGRSVDASGAVTFVTSDPAGASARTTNTAGMPLLPVGTTLGSSSLNDYSFYIDCTGEVDSNNPENNGRCLGTQHPGRMVPLTSPVFVIRGLLSDPFDLSSFTASVGSNAELMVSDPGGRATGFDFIADQEVSGIPQSAHFIDSLDDDDTGESSGFVSRSVAVSQPQEGRYHVTVLGLRKGPYTLTIHRFGHDGSRDAEILLPGIAVPSATNSFAFDFVKSSAGDLNGDGTVNCDDLAIVKASFDKKVGQAGFDPRADVNGDGVVNILDLSFVAKQVSAGTTCH